MAKKKKRGSEKSFGFVHAFLGTIALVAVLLVILYQFNQPSQDNRASAQSSPIKIMPLGDSITYGIGWPGGYRTFLKKSLDTIGISTDYVGSVTWDRVPNFPDKENEGHSGWTIAGIDGKIKTWLTTYTPQVILLQIGTNDVRYNDDLPNAPQRLSKLLDDIRLTLPDAQIFVSSITPLADPALNEKVIAYNAAMPQVVAQKQALGAHITFIDMYPELTVADLDDGIHPNQQGYIKMANKLFSVVSQQLLTTTPTPPLATATPNLTAIPTPTPTPGQTLSFIEIITPSNNAVLKSGGSITASPTADHTGNVQSVKIFIDNVEKKFCNYPTNSCSLWINLPVGTHTIYATAKEKTNPNTSSTSTLITVYRQ